MANDQARALGKYPEPSGGSRLTVHPSYVHAMSMAPLTNKSGGSVVTGDVLVLDESTAESFKTTTTQGDLSPVFVVPYDLDFDGLEVSKTIAVDEIGYVWTPGSPYVSVINCDTTAVAIGDYLVTSSTAKKAHGSGINVDDTQPVPVGAFAIAFTAKAGGSNGTVKAMLLGDTNGGFGGRAMAITAPSNNQVAKWDNDNSTWKPAAALDYILIRDEKAQNTGGGTFTSGAWQTRDLNTEVVDTGGHASLAANQITLAAGTYRYRISAPAFSVDRHQARLQNITDGTTIEEGTSEYSANSSAIATTQSVLAGRFTIAASKVLEVQHRCGTTRATVGFGSESNFTTEVYTVVELWRE